MSKSLAINIPNHIFFLCIIISIHISCIQLSQCRILTQEDYTLYFDEYTFDWANADDWHVITADNTRQNGLPPGSTKIVACTLHVQGMKKNLCVHTKAEGGFTLKFQDFPHLNAGWDNMKTPDDGNSAHQDLENDFEQFIKSQSYDSNEDDAYNIELDFLNDDDWNEINAIWNWNIKDQSMQNINDQQQEQLHAQTEQYYDINAMKNDYYDQFYQQLRAQLNDDDDNNFGAHPQHRRLIERDMNDDEEEFLGSIKRMFRRRRRRYCLYIM